MTVAELIARLRKLPKDWNVWVSIGDECAFVIQEVQPAVVDIEEHMVCSIGEPPDAVDKVGNECANHCVVLEAI